MHPIEYGAAQDRREPPATMALPRGVLPLTVMTPVRTTLVGGLAAGAAVALTDSDPGVLGVSLVTALVVFAIAQRISRRHEPVTCGRISVCTCSRSTSPARSGSPC
jgi:hypothetical protein